MESKEFIELLNTAAKKYGFQWAFGGWFVESTECILVLELQKSNFSNLYYLNIKIYINGVFEKNYKMKKELVKRDVGNIFLRQPVKYSDLFNLEKIIEPQKRESGLDDFFKEYMIPFSIKALSKNGIISLAAAKELYILPAVKKELKIEY